MIIRSGYIYTFIFQTFQVFEVSYAMDAFDQKQICCEIFLQ